MQKRLRIIGAISLVFGLLFMAVGGYAYIRVQDGAAALEGFSTAQNVTLSYDQDGQLIDRGTTEGADAIMALLTETWQWPVNDADLDPNDAVVNTATEYMYQMATIAQHTLQGTQTVVLTATVEYDADRDGEITPDEIFTPGPTKSWSMAGIGPTSTVRTRSRARPEHRPGTAPCTDSSLSWASGPPPIPAWRWASASQPSRR